MKSAPTDDMMPTTIALPRDLGHPGFPRYGKLFGEFSTLWKIFSTVWKTWERVTARARRGRYER